MKVQPKLFEGSADETWVSPTRCKEMMTLVYYLVPGTSRCVLQYQRTVL